MDTTPDTVDLPKLPKEHRWNLEENIDGSIGICYGNHTKQEGCYYNQFVPREWSDKLKFSVTEFIDWAEATYGDNLDDWAPEMSSLNSEVRKLKRALG